MNAYPFGSGSTALPDPDQKNLYFHKKTSYTEPEYTKKDI